MSAESTRTKPKLTKDATEWMLESLRDAKMVLEAWNKKKLTDNETVFSVFASLMQEYDDKPIDAIIAALGASGPLAEADALKALREKVKALKPLKIHTTGKPEDSNWILRPEVLAEIDSVLTAKQEETAAREKA